MKPTTDRFVVDRTEKGAPLLTYLSILAAVWRSRLSSPPGEDGSVVETVVITAVFAALAIAVGAIIVAKVTAKANALDLG